MSRRSLMIAGFSTIVEWYDFTLYIYFATVLARLFYGDGAAGLSVTLAAFAIAYFLRPVGAVVFGHVGDRYGRRAAMLASVALMTATMLATAFLPTRATAGAWAGSLLLALRCLMGFSVGGEYAVVVAYLLEGAPKNRRGLVASLASAASEVGALLAVGVASLIVAVSGDALEQWGWRIPFAFGAILAGSVWILRASMDESPDFQRQRYLGSVPPNPLNLALRLYRRGIARSFAVSALGSITYYVGITYIPVFLVSSAGFSESHALNLSVIAAIAVIAVTPVTGIASDRFGRRPVLLVLAAASAIMPVMMFWLMAGTSWAATLTAALILACIAGGVSAVGAVATAEQFPGEARVTGLALGATSATAIFGGAAPWLAHWLTLRSGWSAAPGLLIALVALPMLAIFWIAPETRPSQEMRQHSPQLRTLE